MQGASGGVRGCQESVRGRQGGVRGRLAVTDRVRDGMKATSRVMVFPVRVFTKICMAQTVQLCKGNFVKISNSLDS